MVLTEVRLQAMEMGIHQTLVNLHSRSVKLLSKISLVSSVMSASPFVFQNLSINNQKNDHRVQQNAFGFETVSDYVPSAQMMASGGQNNKTSFQTSSYS